MKGFLFGSFMVLKTEGFWFQKAMKGFWFGSFMALKDFGFKEQ